MDNNIAKLIPVPYFQINREGTILNFSNKTHSYFHPISNLWNIIQQEDRHKVILMLSHHNSSQPLTQHLVLQTNNRLFISFKCTIQWKDDTGHLVCTEIKNITTTSITPLSVQRLLQNVEKRLEQSQKHLNTSAKILNLRKH
ncbi:hypothetical protein [Priestia megaterium]|uniref:hypothetical protein n=1 Tax=Priestia megaterium TaxID=1404 RepID=UPI001C47ACA5|nr:hypothetical protein [Priestia megaterium]MBV6737699.1 hypothetical protein [Priestia megaterium]